MASSLGRRSEGGGNSSYQSLASQEMGLGSQAASWEVLRMPLTCEVKKDISLTLGRKGQLDLEVVYRHVLSGHPGYEE